ncbi:hypothetical protein A3K29_00695 [Candidatus Collierbacteria bacterium RIFOXYB2_FULL_46_14]|uniref:PPM-type phosphatase domain-containing protein n=1 Tax=Candidatus Collierbacteria bacterium GW2011_GWA2_46_26 TaxID=1618381 RepID=A0A0G1RTF3_9BACT|nr:MAG: hypothetical protein UW29_C0008G0035 [Candidatus Collierbacteria bacterium GW2011_GWC2_44_13]KKU33233.1 MAG: hypothetical protein UX47_C0005G0035 [Candidatus Collierbacteria bacterium GW2011_GWA2_46_26]OGD72655.1 MAG: hypothetical protein A3K29_00695 [Candidatus Collierbacteria bacterium RIFOXYB2_FULL_46_14]OGD75697.1 MAG: hypothetical protein A3K43_00695 [Candidatus Collierbacteria bacterium RIFOXYA2_FULL_46_20]OGD77033.1 MAG: hypothetical protein A3K39_00695 [Candidatus Collierbacteri
MQPQFTLKTGKVIGRSHILAGKNCQDSLKTAITVVGVHQYLVGWISDGCSEGAHSEIGSNLATEFLLNRTLDYLADDIPLEIIHLFLFEDLLSFLKSNLLSQSLKTPQKQALYIKDFLLFTLVGFIIGPKNSTVMAYGDGLVIINDEVYKRDYHDESPYPGYLLIDQKYLDPNRRPIGQEFDIYMVKTANIKKLAIGSDAWLQEFDLVSHVWGHKHPNQVQRNMNIWSDEKKLADDASIIVVEAG